MWHTEGRQSVLSEPVLPSFPRSPVGELTSPRGPLWAAAAGYAAIVGGLLVLIGWSLDLEALKAALPNAMQMKPNTATGLILLGIALALSATVNPPYVPSRARVSMVRLCAA